MVDDEPGGPPEPVRRPRTAGPNDRRVLTPGGWPASPFARVGGYLIDSAIMLAVLVAVTWLGEGFRTVGPDGVADPLPIWWRVLRWAIPSLYVIVLIGRWGATLGQRALRMRVARLDDGGMPGWGAAVVRWAVVTVPGLVSILVGSGSSLVTIWAVVVYLAVVVDREHHQGLHDRAARVVVVETEPRRR